MSGAVVFLGSRQVLGPLAFSKSNSSKVIAALEPGDPDCREALDPRFRG